MCQHVRYTCAPVLENRADENSGGGGRGSTVAVPGKRTTDMKQNQTAEVRYLRVRLLSSATRTCRKVYIRCDMPILFVAASMRAILYPDATQKLLSR